MTTAFFRPWLLDTDQHYIIAHELWNACFTMLTLHTKLFTCWLEHVASTCTGSRIFVWDKPGMVVSVFQCWVIFTFSFFSLKFFVQNWFLSLTHQTLSVYFQHANSLGCFLIFWMFNHLEFNGIWRCLNLSVLALLLSFKLNEYITINIVFCHFLCSI